MMLAIAFFAGGCFWCMESDFEKIPGVKEVVSGYTGGTTPHPTYKQVSRGKTDHTEAIKVSYDPQLISYPELLRHFWINIDPTAQNQQFCDRGKHYRSGIYYTDEKQRQAAERSKQLLSEKFSAIYTEVMAATTFYEAEDYHQDYYKKNPVRYKFYRYRCGRDSTLKKLWGNPPQFPLDLKQLTTAPLSPKREEKKHKSSQKP